MEISGTKQAVEMWADIERAHRYANEAFEKAKAKFMESFATSPSYAIEWRCPDVIAAEFDKSQWDELMEAFQKQETLTTSKMCEYLTFKRDQVAKWLLSNRWTASSSSHFYNAKEMAIAAAASKFYEEISWMVKDAEKAVKDEAAEAA